MDFVGGGFGGGIGGGISGFRVDFGTPPTPSALLFRRRSGGCTAYPVRKMGRGGVRRKTKNASPGILRLVPPSTPLYQMEQSWGLFHPVQQTN